MSHVIAKHQHDQFGIILSESRQAGGKLGARNVVEVKFNDLESQHRYLHLNKYNI